MDLSGIDTRTPEATRPVAAPRRSAPQRAGARLGETAVTVRNALARTYMRTLRVPAAVAAKAADICHSAPAAVGGSARALGERLPSLRPARAAMRRVAAASLAGLAATVAAATFGIPAVGAAQPAPDGGGTTSVAPAATPGPISPIDEMRELRAEAARRPLQTGPTAARPRRAHTRTVLYVHPSPGGSLSQIAAQHHESLGAIERDNRNLQRGANNWGLVYTSDRVKVRPGAQAGMPHQDVPVAAARAVASVTTHAAPTRTHSAATPGYVGGGGYGYFGGPAPGGSFGACVLRRESGGRSQVMNASGHYGLYQFARGTWIEYGGSPGTFGHATIGEQNRVFANALARHGQSNWAPYDGC